MISRKEIDDFIQSRNSESTVEYVWGINCAAVPELLADGLEGEDCRFGLAEHITHTFFETSAAKNLPNGAFGAFCERFCANEQDISTALERTRRDFEAVDVSEADTATTLIWLWFIDTRTRHEIYDVELKFFLYSMVDMVRGDQEVRQRGAEKLMKDIVTKPALLPRLLKCLLKK